MRLILLLLLCTHLYAKSSFEFSAGIANSKTLNQQPSYDILYAKQIQKRSGYFLVHDSLNTCLSLIHLLEVLFMVD